MRPWGNHRNLYRCTAAQSPVAAFAFLETRLCLWLYIYSTAARGLQGRCVHDRMRPADSHPHVQLCTDSNKRHVSRDAILQRVPWSPRTAPKRPWRQRAAAWRREASKDRAAASCVRGTLGRKAEFTVHRAPRNELVRLQPPDKCPMLTKRPTVEQRRLNTTTGSLTCAPGHHARHTPRCTPRRGKIGGTDPRSVESRPAGSSRFGIARIAVTAAFISWPLALVTTNTSTCTDTRTCSFHAASAVRCEEHALQAAQTTAHRAHMGF